jgi:hypothetical protein
MLPVMRNCAPIVKPASAIRSALRFARTTAIALIMLCAVRCGMAQNVPLIAGGLGFYTRTVGGNTQYNFPYLQPVGVLPLGDHLLIEARGEYAEFFSPVHGEGYQSSSFRTMDYLQADVFAGDHATVVAGEYLIPFGTYNERLTQIWIKSFQDFPLIWGLGTMNTGVGVGGQLRGSLVSNGRVSVGYAGYYSANVVSAYFGAERSTGGQGQIYFPESGVEIGASYGRSLGATHENYEGVDLWWHPNESQFRFRSSYAHGANSEGYWLEVLSRLSHFGGPETFLGRFEPAFRMQQTFRQHPDPSDGTPSVNTQQADFGLNYYLPRGIHITTSYSRQFSAHGNVNIWETGIVYPILLPTWKGKSH